MQIEFEVHEGILVIRPKTPRLDAVSASSFRDQGCEKVRHYACVVLDLSEVEQIDSTGLGAIVALANQIPGRASLRLAAPNNTISTPLKLTRLDTVFQTHTSVAGALAT